VDNATWAVLPFPECAPMPGGAQSTMIPYPELAPVQMLFPFPLSQAHVDIPLVPLALLPTAVCGLGPTATTPPPLVWVMDVQTPPTNAPILLVLESRRAALATMTAILVLVLTGVFGLDLTATTLLWRAPPLAALILPASATVPPSRSAATAIDRATSAKGVSTECVLLAVLLPLEVAVATMTA